MNLVHWLVDWLADSLQKGGQLMTFNMYVLALLSSLKGAITIVGRYFQPVASRPLVMAR